MKLRYVELPADRIFNRLGIENLTAWLNIGSIVGNTWWTPKTIELRNEFARLWIEEFDKITGHFSLLEESIHKTGIQRPISTISGPPRCKRLMTVGKPGGCFPPPDQIPTKDIIYTQPFGGSRVTIAQRLKLTVPCAVHDFSNLFPDAPEITARNFRQWFGNEYMFTSSLPHLRLSKQSHIPNSKYGAMNGHTRQAQQQASATAKKQLGM